MVADLVVEVAEAAQEHPADAAGADVGVDVLVPDRLDVDLHRIRRRPRDEADAHEELDVGGDAAGADDHGEVERHRHLDDHALVALAARRQPADGALGVRGGHVVRSGGHRAEGHPVADQAADDPDGALRRGERADGGGVAELLRDRPARLSGRHQRTPAISAGVSSEPTGNGGVETPAIR